MTYDEPGRPANNSMQRTALRPAADAERSMSKKMDEKTLPDQITKLLRKFSQDLSRSGKVFIPGGAVRPMHQLLPYFDFVSNKKLKSNICYAIEHLDYIRWQLDIFHVYGPVASYLYKSGIIFSWMIAEAIAQDFIKQKGLIPGGKTSKNIIQLQTLGIPLTVCDKYLSLHNRRANIHLGLVSDLEHDKYTKNDWSHSFAAVKALMQSIKARI